MTRIGENSPCPDHRTLVYLIKTAFASQCRPNFLPPPGCDDLFGDSLDGVVQIGMTPFEARLAGGAFAYKVVADKTKWLEHSDPLKVMWAQSMQADDSEIRMTFKNASQFPDGNEAMFRVYFERGRAEKIDKWNE